LFLAGGATPILSLAGGATPLVYIAGGFNPRKIEVNLLMIKCLI